VISTTSNAGNNTAEFEASGIGTNRSHIHWGTTGDWYIRSAASTGKVLIQDTGGNTGIGTGTPVSTLSVYNANESTTLTDFTQALTKSGVNIMTQYTVGAYTPGIFWSTQNNQSTKPKAGIWLFENGSGTDMYFGTSNNYATGITNNGMILDEAGNVGINATTTQAMLRIGDGGIAADTRFIQVGDDSYFTDVDVANTIGIQGVQDSSEAHIELGQNGAVISGYSGRIGIGTTTPLRALSVYSGGIPLLIESAATNGALLDVHGVGANDDAAIRFQADANWTVGLDGSNSDAFTIGQYNNYHTSEAAAGKKFVITTLGRVGIGTITPSYQLQLSTNSAAKPTSNAWTVVSDKRLKQNIAPFEDGLETILKIDPVSYELNGKAGTPAGDFGIGVIAQDIQAVAPYTVDTFLGKLNKGDESDTELLTFDSSSLTFVLINAVKEQQAQIEALRKRIEELESRD
jgi:hypothetical protein